MQVSNRSNGSGTCSPFVLARHALRSHEALSIEVEFFAVEEDAEEKASVWIRNHDFDERRHVRTRNPIEDFSGGNDTCSGADFESASWDAGVRDG
jgi:hypothetical protein